MPTDSVTWGDIDIAYDYGFSRARDLTITVRPDLSVTVKAPVDTPMDAIRARVLKRGAWIWRARRQFLAFHPLQPPRQYVPGETHRYLGRQYRLRLREGEAADVKLQHGYILVTTLQTPTPEVLRPLVQDWYRRRARDVLQDRLAACHKHMNRRGVAMPELSLRCMPSRWGSCSRAGRIALNPELVKAPMACIDYVITHELCHLREHHHGRAFWSLLTAIMPDWGERRARLARMADM